MIDLRKMRKKLKKSKAGRKVCRAYAELVAENERINIRAMNAEARLESARRALMGETCD